MSSRGRVLIVEDDWIVAQDFSRILERGGFEVPRIAANAEDALRFFEEIRPDVVLLDIDLGGAVDGVELAAALEVIAPAALVFVTGLLDDRTMEKVKTVASFGYIVKPVSEPQLRSAVELALHRFRAEREMEAGRLKAETEFGELFNAAPDAMVVVDAAGRILLANAELGRRFGYNLDAIKGETVEILVPAALRAEHARHRDWFGGHPHARRMGEMMELSALRADGSPVPVDVSLTPIGGGPNLRVLAVIRDASERRLFQQVVTERRELAEQFDRTLRLETVGRLAGGIAHDFNNLLMVIGGYTDALMRVSRSESHRRLLEGIRAAADRAAELTRHLLAFGRRQVLQPSVVDVAGAVASVQGMLTRVIGEDIQIVTTYGRSLKRVRVDPTQIERVLLNLALNARDAMPNGGILTFDVNNLEVIEPLPLPSSLEAIVPPGEYVKLAVRDNGVGMEPEIAARAFEPFFTTKALGKGTGLGLSTVYGIVKQSSGFVWIESMPGSGTAVHVLLPATLDTENTGEPIPPDHATPRGAGTVLLVEDEPEVRTMLVESLVDAGYDVVDRANGRDAIDAFREAVGRIDLIVTDVVMPHSNGPALVRAARQLQPDVKALYMSGYADDQMVAEIEGDEHSAYLQKPFGLDALLRKIADMLASPPA
jgi:hypothetical protein